MGVLTLRVTPKTGSLVTLAPVLGDEELFVLSEGGILIRTKVAQVSSYGRASQGVTIMRLGEEDRVVSALVMLAEEQLDEVGDEVEAAQIEAAGRQIDDPALPFATPSGEGADDDGAEGSADDEDEA